MALKSPRNDGIPKMAIEVKSMNKLNKQTAKVDDYLDDFKPRLPYTKPDNPVVGPIQFPNGATFFGQVNTKYCLREGVGTQIWEDGSIYTGQWKDDKRHGEGRQIYVDGDFYEGQWFQNKASGKGFYFHVDGTTYEGDLKNDYQEGRGTETWADGSVYKGEFKRSLKHGKGSFNWADGSSFEGEFRNNEINGYGKFQIFFNKFYA